MLGTIITGKFGGENQAGKSYACLYDIRVDFDIAGDIDFHFDWEMVGYIVRQHFQIADLNRRGDQDMVDIAVRAPTGKGM